MSGDNKTLLEQLLEYLEDNTIAIANRLSRAESVLLSTVILIPRKEEIILQWLIDNIMYYKKFNAFASIEKLLSTIFLGLTTKHIEANGSEIRSKIIQQLIDVVCEDSKQPQDVLTSRNQVVQAMLSSTSFRRFFSRDVEVFKKVLIFFFTTSIKETTDLFNLLEVMKHIKTVYKHSLMKEEIKMIFATDIFLLMCKVYCEKEEYSSPEYYTAIMNVVIQIFLQDESFLGALIQGLKIKHRDRQENMAYPAVLALTFKKLPKKYDKTFVKLCYQILFESVIQKFDNDSVLELLINLCKCLGISVDFGVYRTIETKPIKNWPIENGYKIIKELFKILEISNFSLQSKYGNMTFEAFCASLVIGLTNINSINLCPDLISLINFILKLNPLVIEIVIKSIVRIVVQTKNDVLMKKYKKLMINIIQSSMKMQRFQKFMARFLTELQEFLKLYCRDDRRINLEYIWPTEVAEVFTQAVSELPSLQIHVTFKSLLFHLDKDGLDNLNSDHYEASLYVNVVCDLLAQYLTGVKIADISVPDVVREKFDSIASELEEILVKFASFFSYKNIETAEYDEVMYGFLKVCHSYGDVLMLLNEFDYKPFKKLQKLDLVPCNLSYLHSYISVEQWKIIAAKVERIENVRILSIYYDLLMQKMYSVNQIEEGEDGPSAQVARYIIEKAPSSMNNWMWDKLGPLTRLLEVNELLNLLARLIKSSKLDSRRWKRVTETEGFLSNKRLVVATTYGILEASAGHLAKNKKKGSFGYTVVSNINIADFVEYCYINEISVSSGEKYNLLNDSMREIAKKFKTRFKITLKDTQILSPSFDYESEAISKYLMIVKNLPINTTTKIYQNAVFFICLGLLEDLSDEDENRNILLDIMYDIMLEVDETTVVLRNNLISVNSGNLIRCLIEYTEKYPKRIAFMSLLCDILVTVRVSILRLCKTKPLPNIRWIAMIILESVAKRKTTLMKQNNRTHEDLFLHRPFRALESGAFGIELNKFFTNIFNNFIRIIVSHENIRSIRIIIEFVSAFIESGSLVFLEEMRTQVISYIRFSLTNFKMEGQLLYKAYVNMLIRISKTNNESKDLEDLFNATYLDVFNEIIKSCESFDTELLISIIKHLSNYKLKELFKHFEAFREKICTKTAVNNQFTKVWILIIEDEEIKLDTLDVEVSKMFKSSFDDYLQFLLNSSLTWGCMIDLTNSESIRTTLNLLQVYINKSIALSTWTNEPIKNLLSHTTLSVIIEIVGRIPTDGNIEKVFLYCTMGCEILSMMHISQLDAVYDSVSVIFQRVQRFMICLAKNSYYIDQLGSNVEAENFAHNIYQVFNSVMKNKKNVTRIAPYIVANVLDILVKYHVHGEIKHYFENCLDELLTGCDEPGFTYLQANLPGSLIELYKHYHQRFLLNKYTGSV